jgi:6-phosphogluconolactonase
MPGPTLRVLENREAVARTAAQWVHDRAWAVANARGRFTLALSGGTTPRALYRQMAAGPRLPWDRMVFCFGDERNVHPTHPESNAGMARETLTGMPFVDQSSVYRIKGELPAAEAAADYEQTLRKLFPGWRPSPASTWCCSGSGRTAHRVALPALAGAERAPGGWWTTAESSTRVASP